MDAWVWTVTYVHVGIKRHVAAGHTLIWVACAATKALVIFGSRLGPCLGPWHYCSSQGLCCYLLFWGLCGCQGSGQPSETMLVSTGHTATGTVLIWAVCTATGAIVAYRPDWRLKALSGFMVLLQLGFVLVSMVLFDTSDCRKHACWNLRSMLSRPCPSLVLG